MKIARVVGTIVATIQAPVFEGRRLLLCALLGADGEPIADPRAYTIAVDTVGAGAGETVLVLDEGNSARQVVGQAAAPIRAVVVGVVDRVDRPSEQVDIALDRAPTRLPVPQSDIDTGRVLS